MLTETRASLPVAAERAATGGDILSTETPMSSPPSPSAAPMSAGSAARLVENHRRFLSFLERRLGSRDRAEDVLQAAFVRGLERADSLRDEESAVAWFYRLLRNALVDEHRHSAAERRALEAAHQEPEPLGPAAPDAELLRVVCECITSLVDGLKDEYAEAIRVVDLQEGSVAELAARHGISRNLASVRLHRAHAALGREMRRVCGTCAEHGCLDCSCSGSATTKCD